MKKICVPEDEDEVCRFERYELSSAITLPLSLFLPSSPNPSLNTFG